MIKREKILEELGKLGGKAFVSAAALKKEIEALSVEKLENLARRLDLVRRSEFDAAMAMIREARRAQESLSKRLDALEKNLGKKAAGKKIPSKRGAKPAERKTRK